MWVRKCELDAESELPSPIPTRIASNEEFIPPPQSSQQIEFEARLADLSDRVLAVDPRTGTTTTDLWPSGSRPEVEETHDVDDWLSVIASGRCVGVTAESTLTQYRRQGVVFRRLRSAPPVPVRLTWWRDDPHPATPDAVDLLVELYRARRSPQS